MFRSSLFLYPSLFKGHLGVQGDNVHVGLATAEDNGVALQVGVVELSVRLGFAPHQVRDLAAAGKIAGAAAGQVHGDVAVGVAGVAAGGHCAGSAHPFMFKKGAKTTGRDDQSVQIGRSISAPH